MDTLADGASARESAPESADESARTSAGLALQFYWETAEHEPPEAAELTELEEEIRTHCAALRQAAPDDTTVATLLAFLALAKLRAHLDEPVDHHDTRHAGPVRVDDDDEPGRALATEVVRASRQALALRGTDNIAAFSLACALEWLGDHEAAVTAYCEAVRLDPHDSVAAARAQALEEGLKLPCPVPDRRALQPYGFHHLERTRVVGHSGATRGVEYLSTDRAGIRRAAEHQLDEWLAGACTGLDEEFALRTWLPGEAPGKSPGRTLCADLRQALTQTPDGRQIIDWAKVPLPELHHPLPAGLPIRWYGNWHFHGETEHDD
ncbi:hypothetical protein [Streptomyces chattanoogensis]|uniref:hypothetical protein n=1 Tax=Streptomyces chattanoogensis TaxID=66876 RepID=UPI003690646D